ncbi:hypothetical protein ACPCIR_13130 [Mycobacterium sp. NPDC051198]
MLHALRPYMTAGIAIAGASVIAVTPISAPPPPVAEHSIEFSSVQLTSAVIPGATQTLDTQSTVEAWQNLFIYTGAFLSEAFVPLATNPTPILDQVFANQFYYANLIGLGLSYGSANMVGVLAGIPAAFSTATEQLRAGNPEAAILTLWNFVETSVQQVVTPFIPALQIPMRITQNIANVAAAMPGMVLDLGLGAFETVSNTVRTTAASIQSIVDAAGSGDPTAMANAILAAPANIATALLVGDLAQGGSTPGLINGVLKDLVLARDTIAEALGALPREAPEDALAAEVPASDRIVRVAREKATAPATPSETDHVAAAAPVDAPETSPPTADETVSVPKEKPAAVALDTKASPKAKATRANSRAGVGTVRESAKNFGAGIKNGMKKTGQGVNGKKAEKPSSDSGAAD